jgi:hypothetical protein
MRALVLPGALDPNFAALIVFAIVALFLAVVVYSLTVVKNPKLLTSIFAAIGKAFDAVLSLFRRSL